MNKNKILNDPVYGFVNVPYGIIFELVEHPYFQRLRRIKQLSLTHYVYPGALHTRFHHALGALHLMLQAIDTLRSKGIEITEEEAEAVCIAIVLHDIGHGPFSHTLEHTLINVSHETLSSLFMEKLNEDFEGKLDLAIKIFNDQYHKKFLHQLVSGQLDMDRMDYLNRDSFFTGVYEGVIGYDRIIKMLSVHEGALVVEEKGIYSIEKFLIARRLMYWQVYLHKTVLAAELMLIKALTRAKELAKAGYPFHTSESLHFFLHKDLNQGDFNTSRDDLLAHFAQLDDYDIVSALKSWKNCDDLILSYLSQGLIDRKLFKLEFENQAFSPDYEAQIVQRLQNRLNLPPDAMEYFLIKGKEANTAYTISKDEIRILFKNGKVLPMSQTSDHDVAAKRVTKFYLCYPAEGRK